MPWNIAPTGITPAQATSGFHYSGGLEPRIPINPTYNDNARNIGEAIANVMRKRQKDATARGILQQLTGQTGGDEDALNQYLQVRKVTNDEADRDLKTKLIKAEIGHYDRMGTGRGSVDSGANEPNVWTDPVTGKRFAYGSSGVPHEIKGNDPGSDDMGSKRAVINSRLSALKAMLAQTGFKSGDFADPSAIHKGEGPQGEYIPEGYYGLGAKTLNDVVPASGFDQAHQLSDQYNALLQSKAGLTEPDLPPDTTAGSGIYDSRTTSSGQLNPGAAMPAPDLPPDGTGGAGKQLDADTAKQFLQQAGGDKEKARALARAAGYAF